MEESLGASCITDCAAQMAAYECLGIDREISPVTPHDKSRWTRFEALIKAFK